MIRNRMCDIMTPSVPLFWSIVISISCVKLLLMRTYRSTDFEVHRNWLAIVHTFPVDYWYYEDTSKWTLDYPPLFAWFEKFWSLFATWFDPNMLNITFQNYASDATVLFQRLTVIISDLVFAYAINQFCSLVPSVWQKSKKMQLVWSDQRFILAVLLFGNVGLIMVDHIHFQYNGFLFGVQLLSIAMICQDRPLAAAFWFSVLLNLKHIFLYVSPAYFVYLLKNYCFTNSPRTKGWYKSFSVKNFAKLALVVSAVFVISFGPFIIKGHLHQVIWRLFPFKRGLSHAYWAPNFWALYNFTDKLAVFLGSRLGFLDRGTMGGVTMTGGLVQEYHHIVLPSIPPIATLILTVSSVFPGLWQLWTRPKNPWEFIRCVVLCAYGSFLFGWHVHEKAILLVIIPMTLLAMRNFEVMKVYLFLTLVGHYSLFPLLFENAEMPIKMILLILFSSYAWFSFGLLHREVVEGEKTTTIYSRFQLPFVTSIESMYLWGLVLVQAVNLLQTLFGLFVKYQFFPLMVTSLYCAVGVLYSWLKFYTIRV